MQHKGNTHWTQLDNGLQLVVEKMAWLPSVSLTLALPAGVMTDPEGQEGAAVLLNDWLERGAGDKDAQAFTAAFQDLGVRRSSGSGRETSDFSASLLADALPETLALYAEMVQQPQLHEDTFALARTSALQDLAALDDEPVQRLFIRLREMYFASSHGRSSYGTQQGLRSLSPEQVRHSYRANVVPGGSILAIAGGVSLAAVRQQVEDAFGSWQGTAEALPAVAVKPGSYQHMHADTAQTQIGIAYAGVAPEDPHYYHHQLAMDVLSGGMGARLFSEVREKRGLVYHVSASSRTVKHFGYAFAYAGTTNERAQETLEVLLSELKRLSQGVSSQELERARTGMLSNLVMQGESSGARADALARSTFLRGHPRTLDEIKRSIQAISLDEVNDVLGSSPTPDFIVLTLGPEPLTLPA